MRCLASCALFVVFSGYVIDCKNVVFLPYMITSQSRVHGIVAQELSKYGHKTWCAIPSAMERRKKDVFPGVTMFSYLDFIDLNEEEVSAMLEIDAQERSSLDKVPDVSFVFEYNDLLANVSYGAMKNKKLIEYIKDLQPDLIVIDSCPRDNEFVAISYLLDVPFAIMGCIPDYTSAGIPFNPLAEAYNSKYFRKQASLFEQLRLVTQIWKPVFHDLLFDRGYINQLAPSKPKITTIELLRKAEVYIVEVDYIVDYARPTLPNVKYVGGMSSEPPRPLQEPFKSFIDQSEKAGVGILVISFGSLFRHFPLQIQNKLIEMTNRLDLNVIWKTNLTSPNPKKILTNTWIPQNDLLGNKNTRVFISHCGAHSQFEAVYHAVPLACIPLFTDQLYNTERATQKGYGLGLDIWTASVEEMVNFVENVANNLYIRSSISKASEIYHSIYKNPRQEAAFWLDLVMKYGGAYMRSSSQVIPMYLYVLPECLLFFTGVVCGLCCVLITIILRWICGCFVKRSGHLKKD